MFRTANATARQFTRPVVLSRRTVSGDTESLIGTFVVLNDEGWILTAGHIAMAFHAMRDDVHAFRDRGPKEQAIKDDASLKPKERYDRLKALGKAKPGDTQNCSAWWSQDGVALADCHVFPPIDLCVARLENFDYSEVASFPLIKDPEKDVEPGVSLCKLGFPFHSITPLWDEERSAFVFPPEAVPLPLFPIEGMLTRERVIVTPDGAEPFPLKMIEISTPGLKGQSGGPIFDTSGTIWAIQSATAHISLGFDPDVPNGGGRKEHQFLNVGIGVHCESICGALDTLGVSYAKSAY